MTAKSSMLIASIFRRFGWYFRRFWRPQALPFERFFPETYPTRNEILADCAPVTWSEVLHKGGFETLSDIDIALRSYVLGLAHPNQRLSDQLANMVEGQSSSRQSKVVLPRTTNEDLTTPD